MNNSHRTRLPHLQNGPQGSRKKRNDKNTNHNNNINNNNRIDENQKKSTKTQTWTDKPKVKETPLSMSLGESEDGGEPCLLCTHPMGPNHLSKSPAWHFAVGECNHRDVCWLCSLKYRNLFDEKHCCICKTLTKDIILTLDAQTPYQDIQTKEMIYDPTLALYTDSQEHLQRIKHLWDIKCVVCSEILPNEKELFKHLASKHDQAYCKVCFAEEKIWLKDRTLYPAKKVSQHMEAKHERCNFCHTWFFSNDLLYRHLEIEHFRCFLCEKYRNISHQYYNSYQDLEDHFSEEHFLCPDADCREKGFVVFNTQLDLQMHKAAAHTKGKAIKLSFDHTRDSQLPSQPRSQLTSQPRSQRDLPRSQDARLSERRRDERPTSKNESNNNISMNNSNGNETRRESSSANSGRENKEKSRREKERRDKEKERKEHERLRKEHEQSLQREMELKEKAKKEKEKESPQTKKEEGPKKESVPAEISPAVQTKNQEMVKKMMTYLGQEKFVEFRTFSSEFRNDKITAEQYYVRYRNLFGEMADELFPTLVELLPDPTKQQLLLQVDQKARQASVKKDSIEFNLTKGYTERTCPYCNIKVLPNMWKEHVSSHTVEESSKKTKSGGEDFPALPTQGPMLELFSPVWKNPRKGTSTSEEFPELPTQPINSNNNKKKSSAGPLDYSHLSTGEPSTSSPAVPRSQFTIPPNVTSAGKKKRQKGITIMKFG